MPLFSIVTVTFNARQYIENSIKSVVNQNYKDFEYIIIDGCSTDGTLDIINKYADNISMIISEPDTGIYDAMNKALDRVTGDYILFLGADDFLYGEDTLHDLSKILDLNKLDLLIGRVKYTSGKVFTSIFNYKTLLNNTVHHQAALYQKDLFKDFRFDVKFSLIADYELNLRLYLRRRDIRYLFIENFVALCTDGGLSRKQIQIGRHETNLVRRKVLGKVASILKILFELKFYITTKLSA